MYVCMYVCVYVCMYTYIYIDIGVIWGRHSGCKGFRAPHMNRESAGGRLMGGSEQVWGESSNP